MLRYYYAQSLIPLTIFLQYNYKSSRLFVPLLATHGTVKIPRRAFGITQTLIKHVKSLFVFTPSIVVNIPCRSELTSATTSTTLLKQ
jgi:hypothetical protein